MAKHQPLAVINNKYLILDRCSEFTVTFQNMSREYFCVMDVYPVIAPAHPHRHPGWFRFDLEKDGDYNFSIGQQKNVLVVESNECEVTDSWVSDCLEKNIFPVSIRVVIRKKINNEIVFQDRLICYEDEQDYINDKCFFENLGKYINSLPLINRIIPSGLNVKIVTRNFIDGDAIGYFTWEAYALLRKMNISADIYVQNCDDKFRPFVHHVSELFTDSQALNKDTIVFYNYSIQDDYLGDILELPCKKQAYFHGITNPRKLRVFDAELAEECSKGLAELHNLIKFDSVVVNSACTKRHLMCSVKNYGEKCIKEELEKQSFAMEDIPEEYLEELQDEYIEEPVRMLEDRVSIAPPIILGNIAWENISSDGQFRGSIDKIGDVILYVGRMYPHKRIEDILDVFEATLQENEKAILLLIGGTHNSYYKYIDYKIKQMPEKAREHIIVIPQVSRNQLKAAYEAAKVFITMSEDEGFCVPVLEAMRFGLPVFAKLDENSAACEVLGGSGKLVENKDYTSIAREINLIMSDDAYAGKIVSQQNKQLLMYKDENIMKEFINNILECYYGKSLY